MTPLWPNLGFERLGQLDYAVVQYDVEWLRRMGKRLQAGEPLTEPPAGHAQPPAAGPRPLEWNIGQCLLDLANNAAALKALNQYSDRSARLREFNMAVHCLAALELDGKRNKDDYVRELVGAHWKATRDSVRDALQTRRLDAAKAIENIVSLIGGRCLKDQVDEGRAIKSERAKVLELLCEDMKVRAQFSWLRKVDRAPPKVRSSRRK